MSFYNFIVNSKILDIDTLIQTIYQFDIENLLIEIEAKAITRSFKYKDESVITIDFIDSWADEIEINEEFKAGWSSSNDIFSDFIHEFSHAIFNIYGLLPNEKEKLNLNILRPKKVMSTFEIIEYNFRKKYGHDVNLIQVQNNEIIDFTLDQIYQKFQIEKTNNQLLFNLAKWTAVLSMYGRTFSNSESQEQIIHHDTEWLAEAFVYYYLTPIKERTKIWEWWHGLFTNIIPKKYI